MTDIQLIVLRRVRAPLVVLISVYSISILGLVLMPGVDPDGNPWRMSLFDAFYVMSYTATTIGFGEIPYPFSYAQRLWLTVSIYLSVVGWAYALGSVFTLTQNAAFRDTLARGRFSRRVRQLSDPFFVICGYGQSGRRLMDALDRLGYASVVIEASAERLQAQDLDEREQSSVGVVGDARTPDLLEAAGIRKPNCLGLVVLPDTDDVAQTIAIEARVLAPNLPVLARVKSAAARQTLESFGGVTVVNPFETFGFNFGLALARPDTLRLEDWLTGVPGAAPPPRIEAPRGHWVIAGHGRFGRALAAALDQAGLSWKSIDPDPTQCASSGVVGHGMAAEALREAGIEGACGLIAGTDSDANNLAIVTAARRLRPRLFVVIRQNQVVNRSLVDAARADMRFVQAQLMTHECVQLLTTPLLNRFLLRARAQGNAWAVGIEGRIRDLVGEQVPHTWAVRCDIDDLGVRHALLERPAPALTLRHLLLDASDRRERVKATALLLLRSGREILLPELDTPLQAGDRILLAGDPVAAQRQARLLRDDVAIDYVRTGREPSRTWFGRWLERFDRPREASAPAARTAGTSTDTRADLRKELSAGSDARR